MKNDAANAKLHTQPKNCRLSDIEAIVELREVDTMTIDENGEPTLESTGSLKVEHLLSGYYCNNCRDDWMITSVQDKQQAFKLAMEHL